MRWEIEHPDVMRATADFVRAFASVPDPIVAVAEHSKTLEGRIAWVLFGSCLAQEIPLYLLQKVLEVLSRQYPDERLWTFPLPHEVEIRDLVRQAKKTYDWPLEESVPGIFWSVGNFVRRRSPLVGWATSTSYKGILRDLSEIFFMGKGAYQPKAIFALSRLFSAQPRGLAISRNKEPGDICPIPFSFGIRCWMGFLGPGKEIGFSQKEERQKRMLSATFCKALSPQDPHKVSHAFQFFWESSPSGWLCADFTEHCEKCPLAAFCPRSLKNEKN